MTCSETEPGEICSEWASVISLEKAPDVMGSETEPGEICSEWASVISLEKAPDVM
jgi:hypothetical protein